MGPAITRSWSTSALRDLSDGWNGELMLGRVLVVAALALCVPAGPARGQSLSCDLTAGGNWQPNEGPTDYNLHLSPLGTPSAVMVFVDFPDAPQRFDRVPAQPARAELPGMVRRSLVRADVAKRHGRPHLVSHAGRLQYVRLR